MKRFLRLFAIFALLLVPCVARAQDPLGGLAATFPIVPSKLLADPVRNRVYAAVPATNSVAVIDTTTLMVVATVPIGPDPVDMAISMDGNTLYVANKGSATAAVGILDLNMLATRTSLTLSGAPLAVAAGLDGRVYAIVTGSAANSVVQLDGTTGAVQATLANDLFSNDGILQITPDGKTLLAASSTFTASALRSYDVSTATPTLLQTSTNDVGRPLVKPQRKILLPAQRLRQRGGRPTLHDVPVFDGGHHQSLRRVRDGRLSRSGRLQSR